MVSESRTIDTESLRVFVTVAHKHGISPAAEALAMSKSAVSKHLSTLERHLQVRLFERTSRRISVTPDGEVLLMRAESILAELEELMVRAQETKARVHGHVRIAASPEFGALLADRFVPTLLERHPDLKLSMALEYSRDDLHDPGVDLAFRLGALGDDRLVGRQLGSFSRALVCSAAYAQARTLGAPEDLAGANCLLFSDREHWQEWSIESASNLELQRKVKVSGRLAIRGFNAMLNAAIAGLGIARLPRFIAKVALQDGRLIEALPDWRASSVPVYLAYRPGVSRVARVRAVIDAADEMLPPLLANL